MNEPVSEPVDVTVSLPLPVPLSDDLWFSLDLATAQVRGKARRIQVRHLWLCDSEFAWVAGPVLRKRDESVGIYHGRGWAYLSELPDNVRAHILDVTLRGVITE